MASEPASGEEAKASDGEQAPAGPGTPSAQADAAKAEKAAGAGSEPSAPLPGAGTPEGDQLALALRAFEIGDYARVRELCRPLREARQDDVASAARGLDARTRVDSVQVAVLCACLAFFLWIAYVYVIR